jgi:CheY-like chemotaxis protein
MTRAGEFLHIYRRRRDAVTYLRSLHPKTFDISNAKVFILCRSEERVNWFRGCLKKTSCQSISVAGTVPEAEVILENKIFDVLVIDEMQPVQSARSFLDSLHGENRNAPLVIAASKAPLDGEQIRGEAVSESDIFVRQIESAIHGSELSYTKLIESGITKEFLRRFANEGVLSSPAH